LEKKNPFLEASSLSASHISSTILGFHHDIDEIWALLCCYAACGVEFLLTFRDISVPSSTTRPRCPETSVSIYHYTLHKNAEERRYKISSILWKANVPYCTHNACLHPKPDKSICRPPSRFLPLLESYQRISPSPRSCAMFHNTAREELLAPRPTTKLEDHTLSAVCNCFNIQGDSKR